MSDSNPNVAQPASAGGAPGELMQAAPTGSEAAAPGKTAPDASLRTIALPEHVTWRRVHPITPLLKSWQLVAALLAFAFFNMNEGIGATIEAIQNLADIRAVVIPLLVGFGVLVAVIGLFWLSWRAETYAVDADAVYQRTGILAKQLRVARMPRIQAVDVVHPLLGRIFGLGQVTVEVAGGGDSRVTLGYLPTAELERLRTEILGYSSGALSLPTPAAVPAPDADAHLPAGSDESASSTESTRPQVAQPVPLEEFPLYSVGLDTIIRSSLRSVGAIFLVIALIAAIAGLVIGWWVSDRRDAWLSAFVLPLIPVILAYGGFMWKSINERWNFRAFATPVGIRLHRGLSTDTSSTLPPGRVHAVDLIQSPLWRGPGWWKVSATVAGRADNELEAAAPSGVLLPVGDWDQSLRALWLVVPDLGVPNPDAVLVDVLHGTRDDGVGNPQAPIGSAERGFVRVSPRSKLFAPLSWRRKAILLTDTCVIIRRGWWWRAAAVVPYERIQSVHLTQGPLDRKLGTTTLTLDLVEATPPLSGLHSDDAAALEAVISARALRRRETEALDRWLARALEAQDSAPVAV